MTGDTTRRPNMTLVHLNVPLDWLPEIDQAAKDEATPTKSHVWRTALRQYLDQRKQQGQTP